MIALSIQTRGTAATREIRDADMIQKIVVAAFIVKEGKVLLAKRPKSKKLAPDKYHLPGGHVEYGEDVKAALKREIQEELGIEVEVDEPFYSFSYTTDDTHTIGLVCRAEITSSTDGVVLNGETDHVVWSEECALSEYLATDDYNLDAARLGFKKSASLSCADD